MTMMSSRSLILSTLLAPMCLYNLRWTWPTPSELYDNLQSQRGTGGVELDASAVKVALQSVPSPSEPLQILIGKTVSFKDIDSVVLPDIRSFTKRDHVSAHWRLFCYDNATHAELLRRVNHQTDPVEVIYSEGRLKNYFWQHHLTPESISENIDYVWMQDGDMSMQDMDWASFWHLVHHKYRPAIFMPAHHSKDSAYDKTLRIAFTAHYDHCDVDDDNATLPYNHYTNLEAVEVENFETCLPGFRRDVWAFVHKRFHEELPDWGHHQTDWGTGRAWCGLVEREYFHLSPQPGRNYKPEEVTEDCLVDDGNENATVVSSRVASAAVANRHGNPNKAKEKTATKKRAKQSAKTKADHKQKRTRAAAQKKRWISRGRNQRRLSSTNQTSQPTNNERDDERPISCLVIHQKHGLVRHHDSKSYNKKGKYWKTGEADKQEFVKAFNIDQKRIRGRYYYRVFFSQHNSS